MTRWYQVALSVLERNQAAVMITVADVSGSAPRDAGTHMIVAADTQWGTIGGGNLEYQAVNQAREMLAGNKSAYRVDDYPLGPQLGQCCGGYVRLLTSRLTQPDLTWLEALKDAVARGERVRFEMVLEEKDRLRYAVVAHSGSRGAVFESSVGEARVSGDAAEGIWEMIEPPAATVYLFGAGHVGKAVARALGPLPVRVIWIDTREDYAPRALSENTDFRTAGNLVEQVEDAPANAFFLVFTHSHDLDYDVVKAVLQRADYRYCGLIGSRTKRASFERRLRDEGLTDEAIGRLICPIGMSALKSKDPNVIAVGVAAELLTYMEENGGIR